MSLFVKICGLRSAADVEAVCALRPDAIGFVFWARSKRAVTPEEVAPWAALVPPDILKVGVFVDATAEELLRAAETARLDVLQLHGFQGLEEAQKNLPRVGNFSEKSSNPWKIFEKKFQPLEKMEKKVPTLGTFFQVWSVAHVGDAAADASECVDAFLLDSYSVDLPGGTGQTCDWDQARAFVERSRKPVLLAGGLTPENVGEAVRKVRPWGVDVSSGVEAAPGKKDIQKVQRFIEQCRTL